MKYADARALALGYPGVEEALSYGTRSFKVRKKLMARLKEDGETLIVRTDMMSREMLLRAHPRELYLGDHYVNYPWVLVRLKKVSRKLLRELIEDAWLLTAPRAVVGQWRGAQTAGRA